MTNITNSVMMQFANELRNIETSLLRVLLNGRIKEFKKLNGQRIDTISAKAHEIQKKWLVFENDVLKIEEGKPVALEGKNIEDYYKEFEDYMKEPCPLHF